MNEAVAGSKKILLVAGNSLSHLDINKFIKEIDVPIVQFSDFTPNPLYEEVCKGVELFNSEMCDTILGIGGGSAMDVAKCIKLYCRMHQDKLYLEQEYKDTGVKLIAIPTTAGTGSESTRYAVIYYDGKKQSVTHDSILPNVAILEPSVLKKLPVYQKKCTMLDALCQGIESWWSVNSTDKSKILSRQAVEIILQWWHEYIFENTDESAKHIMEAANLAGQAISITQTTAPHAFSYKITSIYKIPHGHAVAVCLPEIWEYMLNNMDKCVDSRGSAHLSNVFIEISKVFGVPYPLDAVMRFRQMLTEMELSNPVSNSKDTDIAILCCSVNPIRLKNNPVALEVQTIQIIYNEVVR